MPLVRSICIEDDHVYGKKIRIYKTILGNIVVYCVEVWKTGEEAKQSLEAMETGFW